MYVVVDLEFNQPYDFKTGEVTKPVEQCRFEVIQIGVVKMDKKFDIVDSRSFLIKPQIYNRMHPVVERITGLTTEKLILGKAFPEVYKEFIDYISKEEYTFCFWGASDIKILYRNIEYYKLSTNLISKLYINVQQLASLHLKQPNGMLIGLQHAVESLEIGIDNHFHNALYDALYTAKILKELSNDNIQVLTFDISDRKKVTYQTDVKLLYSIVEKDLGHKLNKKEKQLTRKIYELGKTKSCEV